MFAEELLREGVCQDVGPLYAAASECRLNGDDTWGYSLDGLTFRIGKQKGVVPREVISASLQLWLSLQAYAQNEEDVDDPLSHLAVDVEVRGSTTNDEPGKYLCCWHIDRDLGDGSEQQEYMHPVYHLQQGGHRISAAEGRGAAFGDSLFLDAPRIAHPPLDAILAVDFVLTNYFPQSLLEFRSVGFYRNLVASAQRRLWRPYALAVASYWSEQVKGPWQDMRLWPQFLKP